MANSIEVPVRLSLEQAQSQAEALRRILQESVQPNSSEFRAISTMIERATTQAERLKQTMGESLKTSSSSKKFNNDLQKTFDLLATVTGRLQNVSGKNLIFSESELSNINEANSKIQELQKQITDIQAGKIGHFFDDSTITEFKQLQELTAKWGKNLSELTFSDLSSIINKELNTANASITDTTNRIQQLDNVLKNTKITDINKLITSLQDSTASSTIEVFKSDSLDEAAKRLSTFYNQIANLNIRKEVIKPGASISDFIHTETVSIEANISQRIGAIKARKEELQKALNSLLQIMPGTTGQTKAVKESILNANQNIIEQLGFGTNWEKMGNLDAVAASIRQKLQESINNSDSQVFDLSQLRTSLLNQLSTLFDGLDSGLVVGDAKGFKNIIAQYLGEQNVDIKDSGIARALEEIKKNSDVGSVLQNITNAVKNYVAAQREAREALAQTQAQQQSEAAQLQTASQTVSTAQTQQMGTIEELRTKIAELEQQIHDLVQTKQQVNQQKIETDPAIANAKNQYEQATQALQRYTNGLAKLESKQQALGNVQNAVTRWMGFYQVLNLGKRAIQDMKTHIQELDTVMTQIAVVTNMSQDDLWGQIGKYSQIARQYGVAIKGVYEVSQIYYQQGLNQGDVMNLTTETLKMARIAGLDYATAADYMTTAIRGFKLEMTDAAHVTDVYSALAAKTASSTEELAVAISKTASSAEAVGSSFEATSAMMATMISVTRESATNIGTALKSVISRYGEMTSDPSKLVDSEGEEMSLNRVDAALKTIGITIQDVNGQFRDFDDVILELGEKWDTLDKNSQRYIATLMAGNRQQSRFLSLVGNIDEYKNALEIAQNSEGAGELQTLKTLDSIDARIEKMKVTIQEFYTSSGIQDAYKSILDTITNVMSAANDLPKAFGKIPVAALAIGGLVVNAIKGILSLIIVHIRTLLSEINLSAISSLSSLITESGKIGDEAGQTLVDRFNAKMAQLGGGSVGKGIAKTLGNIVASILNVAGSALTLSSMNKYGASTSADEDKAAAKTGFFGAALTGLGGAASGAIMGSQFGAPGAIAGAIIGGLSSAIAPLVSAINMNNVTLARQAELDQKAYQKAKDDLTLKTGEQNDLQNALIKLKQLEAAQYDSAEAAAEYTEYMNQLADSYPSLVSALEITGDRIITTADLENELANARLKTAEATATATQKELDGLETQKDQYNTILDTINSTLIGSKQVISPLDIIKYSNLKYGTNYTISENNEQNEQIAREILANYADRAGDRDSKINILHQFQKGWEFQDYNIQNRGFRFINGGAETTPVNQENVKKNLLLNLINTIDDTFTDFEYEQYFEVKKEDLLKLSGKNLSDALENAVKLLNDQIKVTADSIEASTNSLEKANLLVQLEKDIGSNDAFKGIDKYSSFITSYANNNNELSKLEQFVSQNLENMEAILESLDFSSIKNYSEIEKATEIFPKEIQENIIDAYKIYFNSTSKNLQEAIDHSSLSYNREFTQLFSGISDEQIVPALYPIVQQGITSYKELEKSNLTIAANNYKNNFINLLKYIASSFTGAEQAQLYPILSNLDLTDTLNIETAIKSLENLKEEMPNIEGLLSILNQAKKTVVNNINIWAQQLEENIKDIAESSEKIFSNIGKTQEYSKIYEAAKEIADKSDNKYIATDLISYDKELQGWILNQTAAEEALNQLISKKQSDIKSANEQLQATQNVLQTLQNVDSRVIKAHLLGRGEDREQAIQILAQQNGWADNGAELQSILDAYDNRENKEQTLEQFLNEYYILAAKKTKNIIDAVNNVLVNEAISSVSSLDFSTIAGGTANKNIVQTQLATALEAIKPELSPEEIQSRVETIYNDLYNGVFTSLEDNFGSIISDTVKRALLQEKFNRYQSTISELLEVNDFNKLSQQAKDTLSSEGLDVQNSAESMVEAAGELLSTIKNSYTSISDYNVDAKKYLENSLKEELKPKAIYDFATSDITIDSITSLADNLGDYLDKFINLSTGEVKGELGKYLSYNKFTGTYDITGTVEEFVAALNTDFGILIEQGTTEYLQIVETIFSNQEKKISERNSLLVKQQERQDQTAIRNALKDITFTGKEQFASLSAIESLANALGVDVNLLIGDYIAELDAYTLNGDITQLDLDKIDGVKEIIAESINAFIASLVDLVSKGISGSLSQADVSNLKGNLGQLGLNKLAENLDFTRTVEGLKLSQNSAIQLYNALKKTDALSASLVFDELNKSLQESNEHYKGVSDIMNHIQWLSKQIAITDGTVSDARKNQYSQELALAKEILAVRSTTEDDSFNFMSKAIPGAQNNPINYYENWATAVKTLNEAFENQGTYTKRNINGEIIEENVKSGFIDYKDWYNIVSELNNIAALGGPIEFAGETLDGSLERAAALIQKGAASLVATDTGEIKVALSGMEISFEEGADAFNSGVDDGIRAVAQGQIKMLDGMIQLLETVVAMEKLGDITGGDNTIDLGDLFPSFEGLNQVDKQAIENKQAIDWINKYLLEAPEDSDIGKFVNGAIINGQNLKQLLVDATDQTIGLTKENAQTLTSLINSLWQMYQSGEYNLDDLYGSIQQIANASNLDMVIPMGDTTLHVKHGAVIIEEKDDQGKTIFTDSSGKKYDTFEEAVARSAIAAYHVDNIEYKEGIATGTIKLTLDGQQVEVNVKSNANGEVSFTADGGTSYTDWNQYVRDEILKGEINDETIINQKSIEIGLQLGTVKLNSVSYKAIDSKIRQELESAFAAGDTIKIQTIVEQQPVLKSLKGKSAEEIAQTVGIKTETLVLDITANAPIGEGADVLAQLMTEPEPSRTITVNTEIGTDNAKILGKTTLDPIPMDTLDVIVQTLQVILRSNPDMTEIDNVVQAIQNMGATPIEQLESLVKILAFVSGVTDLTALDNVVQAVKNGGAPSIEELQSFIGLLSFISQKTDTSNLTGEVKNVEDNWSTDNPVSPLTSYVSALFIQLAAGALNTKDLDSEVNKVKAPDTPPLTSYVKELLIQLVNKLPNMDEVNEVVDTITQAKNISELTSIAEQLLIKKGWTKPIEDEGLVPTGTVPSNSSIETLAVLVEALKYIANKTNGGKLNVDEKDIKVPDQLSGEYDVKALIAQALLDWANKENYDLSNIVPENGQIDLGTYKGKIKIDEIEVENLNKNKDPVLKLYEERKTRQLTSEDFSAASKQAALQRNELGYNPISAAEYAASWSKYNSPLLNNMKEAIISGFNEGLQEINKSSSNNEIELSPTIQTNELESALKEAQNIYESLGRDFNNINVSDFAYWLESIKNVEGTEISFDVDKAEEQLLAILDLIGEIPDDVKTTIKAADKASGTLSKIASQLKSIPLSKVTTVTTKYVTSGAPSISGINNSSNKKEMSFVHAKGNVALAKGRKTLLGELGPELYVTNGHYYVAGQNGAEFVDLPDDAIVFNHLQTQRLLKNGSAGRGKAVTNEKKATSLATGNAQGPAMASASAALSALKQLRSMWESLLSMSIADLAGKAGSGGGGGSGNDSAARAAFIKDVERWYNWLQKIAELEKEINYQERLRSKMQSDRVINGAAIYKSQRESLKNLNDELVTTQSLLQSQKMFFEERRQQLNEANGPFNQIYTFDEKGQLKYRSDTTINGIQGGFNFLADLFSRDEQGVPKYSYEEQYNILAAAGFEEYMKYDSSGKEILKPEDEKDMESYYANAIQAVIDHMDSDNEEMQSLHDSITDYEEKSLELFESRNQILQDIVDNQLAVEDRVLTAIVDNRQAQIDEAQKERDALEKSQQKFIDGLQTSLNKERQMYENEQDAEELNKMRRQLGILQRSGGSASSIRSLQDQISQREKDAYFNSQQQQIDAIQEASNLELERLDAQIELMTETLEYQKENGLLWNQVAQAMQGTPEQINNFIMSNEKAWASYSELRTKEELRTLNSQTEQWNAYRTDQDAYWKSVTGESSSIKSDLNDAKNGTIEWKVYDAAMAEVLGEAWESIRDKVKDAYQGQIDKTGDPRAGAKETEKSPEYQAWRAMVETQKNNNSTNSNSSSSSNSSSGGSGGSGKNASSPKAWHISADSKKTFKSKEEAEDYKKKMRNMYWNDYAADDYSNPELLQKHDLWANSAISYYDKGGLNDYTGLAMLHGTKQKPESIFNAEQTRILREDILGGGDSLLSLLVDFKNAMNGTVDSSNYTTTNNESTESIVIEHAEVNMNVASIANDYDARRAGNMVMDEMVKIARKNGMQNNIGR